MRKTQVFKKRILALALSITMVFASMDTYVVLAEESANQGEIADTINDSATADSIDSTSQSNTSDETNPSIDSDTAEENGSSNDSDTVGDSAPASDLEELLPESQSEEAAKASSDISWSIDTSGCLTITGTGDYEVDDNGNPAWAGRTEEIFSAVVNISGITSTKNMFNNCSNMLNVDLLNLDTSSVTDMTSMFSGCSSLTDLDLSGFKTGNVKTMSMMFFNCSNLRSLDLSNFDTNNVTDMSMMFYQCVNLNGLNLSNFNTGNVIDMLSMFPRFTWLTNLDLSSFDMKNVTDGFSLYGSNRLTRISVPKNIPENMEIFLPTEKSTDKWYDEDTNVYTKLPTGLTDSITLYKNAFSEDDPGTLKKVLNISGITINSKTYDGMPNEFIGTPVVKDMAENIITDVIINYHYAGTLMNGDGIENPMEAPTQAGRYSLVFSIEENDKYTAEEKTYSFNITQKEVTITAPTVSIVVGEDLPAISELTYQVDGLLENDTFITKPQLKYSTENITTSMGGSYEIIPYGADAGNNYRMNYVKGTLFVEEIVAGGTTNNISWQISKNGRFTITGTGDYEVDANGMPPWAGRDDIRSVVVNVSDITSTRNMFYGFAISGENIDLSNLDTSKVTDMSHMFYGFNLYQAAALDLSSFDTGNVTDMSYMFSHSYANKIDFSSFHTSNVTNMSGMFEGFNQYSLPTAGLDLRSFDTGNVTDMSYMFYDCGDFNLYLGNFKTDNVKNMSYIFARSSSWTLSGLSAVDLSSFDTGNITDMSHMFENSDIHDLDLSSFDTSNVTDMNHMFYNCDNLTDLNLSSFHTEKVTNMNHMFTNAAITNLDLSSFDFRNVTNMNHIFVAEDSIFDMIYPNDTLQSLDLGDFNISKMTNTSHMFDSLLALTSIHIDSSDTSNVTNMENMFDGCQNLESLDLSSFDTGKVKTMNYMFHGCGSLTDLDLSSFDTSSLEKTQYMFKDCKKLKNINLSGFDTSKVFKMNEMFYNCSALAVADLSSFDLSNVTNMENLFYNCTKLSLICTPRNCNKNEVLPTENSTDKWYDENKKVYTALPKGLSDSIALYKNAYPGDGTGTTNQALFISGITINDKVYDKTANPFIGTPVAKDSSGHISDVSINYSYSGKLTDGSAYAKTTQPPTQAGNYKLIFEIDESDVYLAQNAYSFRITPKEVTITADSVIIEKNSKNKQIPAISELTYTVEGLLDGDTLLTDPQLKYSVKNISTDKSGRYDIIPYGAEVGRNYRIQYVNGKLAIIPPDDDPEWGDVSLEDRPEDRDISDIPNGLWIAGVKEKGYAYIGSAIKPEVRVYDYTTRLLEKTDYTISYKNNTKANDASVESKAPTITVTSKGNYSGKDTKTFEILPLDISPVDISLEDVDSGDEDQVNEFEADDISIVYNGKTQKPVPTLFWNGKKLKNKTDYTFTYHEGTYAGIETKELASVQEAGNYYIKLTGTGNFTGTRRLHLTVLPKATDVSSLKPISKVTVSKIPNQSYLEKEDADTHKVTITPEVTVKYGSETLVLGTHYTVTYSNNTRVGTAYAIIRGIEENGYSGTKRVSFKITGMAISKAKVTGLSEQTFIYSGVNIEPNNLTLTIKINGEERILVPKTDYKVTWQNNQSAGKATAVFTGLGGYTGTVKKTFTIKKFDVEANAGRRFAVELEEDSVPYTKGGAKPTLKVTFIKENGEVQTLMEGKDYTLSCKNNTSVNDRSNADKMPTVTIKGKGSFSGTYATKPTYRITTQDIGNLDLSAADKTYQNKKNIYVAKVTITDLNGKTLKAGTDYDKEFTYVYKSIKAPLADGTVRKPGDVVDKNDIIPAGTVLEVTVSGTGNYTESIKGEYRITQASISGASVSIPKQDYTGQEITFSKDQITVKVKGKNLDPNQYEIVPDSYQNNIKKGTASVTIRGINNYGGTKTVKFTIKAKGFLWWWRN